MNYNKDIYDKKDNTIIDDKEYHHFYCKESSSNIYLSAYYSKSAKIELEKPIFGDLIIDLGSPVAKISVLNDLKVSSFYLDSDSIVELNEPVRVRVLDELTVIRNPANHTCELSFLYENKEIASKYPNFASIFLNYTSGAGIYIDKNTINHHSEKILHIRFTNNNISPDLKVFYSVASNYSSKYLKISDQSDITALARTKNSLIIHTNNHKYVTITKSLEFEVYSSGRCYQLSIKSNDKRNETLEVIDPRHRWILACESWADNNIKSCSAEVVVGRTFNVARLAVFFDNVITPSPAIKFKEVHAPHLYLSIAGDCIFDCDYVANKEDTQRSNIEVTKKSTLELKSNSQYFRAETIGDLLVHNSDLIIEDNPFLKRTNIEAHNLVGNINENETVFNRRTSPSQNVVFTAQVSIRHRDHDNNLIRKSINNFNTIKAKTKAFMEANIEASNVKVPPSITLMTDTLKGTSIVFEKNSTGSISIVTSSVIDTTINLKKDVHIGNSNIKEENLNSLSKALSVTDYNFAMPETKTTYRPDFSKSTNKDEINLGDY